METEEKQGKKRKIGKPSKIGKNDENGKIGENGETAPPPPSRNTEALRRRRNSSAAGDKAAASEAQGASAEAGAGTIASSEIPSGQPDHCTANPIATGSRKDDGDAAARGSVVVSRVADGSGGADDPGTGADVEVETETTEDAPVDMADTPMVDDVDNKTGINPAGTSQTVESARKPGSESPAILVLYNKVYPGTKFGDESAGADDDDESDGAADESDSAADESDDSTPTLPTYVKSDVPIRTRVRLYQSESAARVTPPPPPPPLSPPPIAAAAALAVQQTPPPIVTELAATVRQASKPLQENPAAVYLAGLAPGSRRTMRASLDGITSLLTSGRCTDCLELDWANLRYQHTSALRALLAEKYAAATVNKILCALRGTLKAAWRLGQISAEEYARARDVGSVSGEVIPAGRSLAGGEIAALMAACQADKERSLGTRDAAILALLYGCGLRRAEVVALQLVDCREEASGVSLRVRGKRNKQRLVPLTGGVADAVGDWLAIRGHDAAAAGMNGDVGSTTEAHLRPHLFNPFRKGGRRQGDRAMTTQAVYVMLEKRAQEAGVADFSPHDCRRTFVGDLLDRGADIVTVQKLAGHASVTTTARYDRRGEGVKRKAAELLHVPYRRRT